MLTAEVGVFHVEVENLAAESLELALTIKVPLDFFLFETLCLLSFEPPLFLLSLELFLGRASLAALGFGFFLLGSCWFLCTLTFGLGISCGGILCGRFLLGSSLGGQLLVNGYHAVREAFLVLVRVPDQVEHSCRQVTEGRHVLDGYKG